MTRSLFPRFGVLVLLMTSAQGFAQAQLKPEAIERGKKASALVVISSPTGWTGSAFCIDPSGQFLTNAHVVEKAIEAGSKIELMVDSGLATQRVLGAKLLRHDDRLDLALLQVDAPAGLTPLELGTDADLIELADVVTIGSPFGPRPPAGLDRYPAVSLQLGHITSLRKDKGQLLGVQVDSQLNPGHSGGPVLDASGKVIGMVAATVRGAAMNLAVPVGRLAEFLAAPGLVFNPPPLTEQDRTRPVTWTIRLEPPTSQARLPEGVTITVTLPEGAGSPRTFTAEPAGANSFQVTLNPFPSEPDRGIDLQVRFSARGPNFTVQGKDKEITVGGKKLKLSDVRLIFGGASPRVETTGRKTYSGPIEGLDRVRTRVGQQAATLDLKDAMQITVRTFDIPVSEIVALVEARRGSKVLATVRTRTPFTATPMRVATVPKAAAPRAPATAAAPRAAARAGAPRTVPGARGPQGDEGLLKLGTMLNVDGVPRGAGKAIQPPAIAIPAARLTPGAPGSGDEPLVRRTEGAISDVTVGGGGRYLLLTLKAAHKLAVFDVNAADIVKAIPLPSSNVLVAAGAKKVLIALPDEKRFERRDLATMERDGDSRPSPIDGRLRALALGSDSDGPALAFWSVGSMETMKPPYQARFCFIDLGTLTVQKARSIAAGRFVGMFSLSASGGSFVLDPSLGGRADMPAFFRASAGGALFAIWKHTNGNLTLQARGPALVASYPHLWSGQFVPGPDGRTIFTAGGYRLDAEGFEIDRAEPDEARPPREAAIPKSGLTRREMALASATSRQQREPAIPTSDPSYFLRIGGLPPVAIDPLPGGGRPRPGPVTVTVSVHAASDRSRLLTVYGLDEMGATDKAEDWYRDDLTTDKRFHFVPAAHLLITIPPTNDRLVLRRLDLDEAQSRMGGDRLLIVSPPNLDATAGQKLDHRILARSKKGGITCTIASGPDGLTVAPDGQVTWMVPERLKGQEVTVVVAVGDASGEELFHTLKIRVR